MGTTVVGAVTKVQAIDAVVASERTILIHGIGEKFDGTSPLILWCHGGGGTCRQMLLYTQPTIPKLLAKNRFVVLSGDWALDSFGNAACVTAMETALTWAGNNGIKTDLIGVMGYSMGMMSMASFWVDNPTVVGAGFAVNPAVHGQHLYDDNAGQQAGMNTAWGGNYTTNGAPNSPHLILPGVADDMLRLHYSSTDTVIRDEDVTAFATDVNTTAVDIEPAVPSGHSGWTTTNQDEMAVLRHFQELLF